MAKKLRINPSLGKQMPNHLADYNCVYCNHRLATEAARYVLTFETGDKKNPAGRGDDNRRGCGVTA